MPKQKKPAPRQRSRSRLKRKPRAVDLPRAFIEPYDSDDPLQGIPVLAQDPPTTLIVVHAAFTAQHVINELRYHFEMHNLQNGDLHLLAQLGKEVAAELEKENL